MKRKIYERIQGGGTLKGVPLSLNDINREEGALLMCPYTNYIPLSYLLAGTGFQHNARSNSYIIDSHKLEKKKLFNGGMFAFAERAFRDVYINKNTPLDVDVLKDTMQRVNKYLFFDEPICPNKQKSYNGWNTKWREDIIKNFENQSFTFRQRSFHGYCSPYSLYRTDDAAGQYISHVLAVVRPEHYMWLKLNYLLTGNIDMSKVVILIDSQLDTTLFPSNGFKALYKQIKPKILETAAQIWRVPLEFIQENCFLPKFELKEKNIIKRKAEIDRLIEEFYESERNNPTAIDGNYGAGSIGIMEQMGNAISTTSYTYDSTLGIGTQAFTINMDTFNMSSPNVLTTDTHTNWSPETPYVDLSELPDFDEDGVDEDIPYEEEELGAEVSEDLGSLPF